MGRQDVSSAYGLMTPSPAKGDGPARDARVAAAHRRLEAAERRLATMRACLEGVGRDDPRYQRLLPHCQILERALFSRRLELDEVLRDVRRRLSGGRVSRIRG